MLEPISASYGKQGETVFYCFYNQENKGVVNTYFSMYTLVFKDEDFLENCNKLVNTLLIKHHR